MFSETFDIKEKVEKDYLTEKLLFIYPYTVASF